MSSSLFENLKKFIQVIDKLKDIGLDEHVKLPKIIVVGSQSSGKSSLLESIVGIDFLPRGSGVVTRRPLELRLVNMADLPKPYAIFDKTDTKIYDFQKVRQEIIRLTDEVAGVNKGIVDQPIVLKVFSGVTPDLTLVDLPGITRIAIHNSDQKENIEKVTVNMARRYIEEARSIILCVVPANADISTSDGLKLARDIDPSGHRTLGVITKVDIMDKGTDARAILLNQAIPLRLGYIAVKNRCQQDIIDQVDVQTALKQENTYFAQHQVYSSLPEGLCGTTHLTQKLSDLLYKHIKYHLPDIFQEMDTKVRDSQTRLSELGTSLPTNPSEKFQLLFSMITKYAQELENSIKGKFSFSRKQHEKNLPDGAKLRLLFNDLFIEYCRADYKAADRYTNLDISNAIKLHEGDTLAGFQSIDSFFYLLHPILDELKDPALDCINNIFVQLEQISTRIFQQVCIRLPCVQTELQDLALKYFEQLRENTRQVVEDYMDAQINYIYTTDNESLNSYNELLQAAQLQAHQDSKELLVKEMRNKIDVYIKVIVRELRDTIPKMIGFFFIQKIENQVQMVLVKELNENMDILMNVQENPLIKAEREKLQHEIQVLNNAKNFIKKDPKLMDFIQERSKIMMEQQEQNRIIQKKREQQIFEEQRIKKQQELQEQQQKAQQQQLQGNHQQQSVQPNIQFVDNTIDKGVDTMFANKKFQQQMNNVAQNAVKNAVNSQVPMKGKDGSNPLGNMAAKATEKALQNDKVQNAMKDQVKNQVKQEVKKDKKGFFW